RHQAPPTDAGPCNCVRDRRRPTDKPASRGRSADQGHRHRLVRYRPPAQTDAQTPPFPPSFPKRASPPHTVIPETRQRYRESCQIGLPAGINKMPDQVGHDGEEVTAQLFPPSFSKRVSPPHTVIPETRQRYRESCQIGLPAGIHTIPDQVGHLGDALPAHPFPPSFPKRASPPHTVIPETRQRYRESCQIGLPAGINKMPDQVGHDGEEVTAQLFPPSFSKRVSPPHTVIPETRQRYRESCQIGLPAGIHTIPDQVGHLGDALPAHPFPPSFPKRASPPHTVIPETRQRYRESCQIGLPAGINKMPDQVGHDGEEVTAQLFPPSFSKRVSPPHTVIPETRQRYRESCQIGLPAGIHTIPDQVGHLGDALPAHPFPPSFPKRASPPHTVIPETRQRYRESCQIGLPAGINKMPDQVGHDGEEVTAQLFPPSFSKRVSPPHTVIPETRQRYRESCQIGLPAGIHTIPDQVGHLGDALPAHPFPPSFSKRVSPPHTVIPETRQRYRESCQIGLPAGINKMPDQVGHDGEEVTAQLFPPSFSKRVSPPHTVIPETRRRSRESCDIGRPAGTNKMRGQVGHDGEEVAAHLHPPSYSKRLSSPPPVIPEPRQRYRESCQIGLPAGINKMPDQVGHDGEEVTARLFPPSFSKRVSPPHTVIP